MWMRLDLPEMKKKSLTPSPFGENTLGIKIILGTMTVNLIESLARHPAVSLIMAEIVALDVAINWNVGQPGQNNPSYPPQSIEPMAAGERLVAICKVTLSPPATVIFGP